MCSTMDSKHLLIHYNRDKAEQQLNLLNVNTRFYIIHILQVLSRLLYYTC